MRRIEIIEDNGRIDVYHKSCGDVLTALGLLRLAEVAIIEASMPQWPEKTENDKAREN